MSAPRFAIGTRSPRLSALIALLIAGALVLGVWTVAQAHATLVSSEPAAGSRLTSSPTRVRLVFSEQVEPSLTQLSIVAGDGSITHLGVIGDVHDVHAVVAPVAGLSPGAYRLTWRVVSADGHPVGGSFAFSVGVSASQTPTTPGDTTTTASRTTWGPTLVGAPLIPAVLRGLGVGTLMALAGVLLFLSLPRVPGGPVAHRAAPLAKWLALATSLFLALHLVAWILNVTPEHQLGGDSTTAVLASGVGKVELWRTGLALLALWAVWLARRLRLALLFAGTALAMSGASGHSAAIDPVWAMPAKVVHLTAGAAWLGGLLWLVTADRSDARLFARDASRVSTIALISVIGVTLSGVEQAWLFLPSPWDLFRSSYGVVTLAKIVGLIVLIAFGAFHRSRVLPRLEGDATVARRFTASLRGEVVIMCLILLLGGLLAYISPPDRPASHEASIHSPVLD